MRSVLDAITPTLAAGALLAMGWACRLRPALRRWLVVRQPGDQDGFFQATMQFATRDGKRRAWTRFHDGRASAGTGDAPGRPDVTVAFRNADYMRRFFLSRDADLFGWLLENHISFDGNLAVLAKFGLIASAVALGGRPKDRPADKPWPTDLGGPLPVRRHGEPIDGSTVGNASVQDAAFSRLTLTDFPRLGRHLDRHFHTRPRICTERARLWTEAWMRERREHPAEPPTLRQARVFDHVMRCRAARIDEDCLLAGTTTSHLVGVQVFPELGGTAIWPELLTVSARDLNPYELSDEDGRVLDQEVFPCWARDNIREWARASAGNPRCLRLEERWVLYFLWKNHAISHTIPDFPTVLSRGLTDLAQEARERAAATQDDAARGFLEGAAIALEAVVAYSERLADEAERQAREAEDPTRRGELEEVARICRKVPGRPAATLHEAVQSIWTCFLALHQENMNAGLSFGRLDQWLQPYFEADLGLASDAVARDRVAWRAIELAGSLMLKATDHLPLVADIGNRLFGGSSSDQVITLGGQRRDGTSGVLDMTWIFLKATEMLALRDPNMNARYCPGVDPPAYLKRLCEVNLLTGATPSMHNDLAVGAALARQGIAVEDARDWGATGCVEPTICGRHMGHTNCMMFNMVAPLEMMLHDGVHPLIEEQVGPATGDPRGFASFDEVMRAYLLQLGDLIDVAAEANDLLGRAHQAMHPTPFLSALVRGTLESGRDLVDGGALYNSSGTAMVGLADVVDSLSAIRTLVFDKATVGMGELMDALAADFAGCDKLLARIMTQVSRFGSGDPIPTAIANEVVDFVFERWQRRTNYRGGRYVPGYWSMSNHVAFGLLTGALPNGRRRGKPFTPGLTPSSLGRDTLLDNMRQVAGLDPSKLPNNIAFNVRLAPGAADTHGQMVDRMTAYVGTYFDLGGMQFQFNVVDTQTLRRAMEHPDAYRGLLVRISGYNAYFVELNRDMQVELLERTERR